MSRFRSAIAAVAVTVQITAAFPAVCPLWDPPAFFLVTTGPRSWRSAELLSLCRHLDNDNNKSERALRTPVAGRKNYYGSHAEWSAHLAARVWTITATAERHHLEPLEYLTSYLSACGGGKAPAGLALDRFLPWLPGAVGSRDHDPPKISQSG